MAIDYIKSQAAPNGNVQLVANLYPAQMPLNIVSGDKVYIFSSSGNYSGVKTVERVIMEGNTAILQIAATPFKVPDVGIYNKVSTTAITESNPNPGATPTVSINPGAMPTASNPAVSTKSAVISTATPSVAELKTKINAEITAIKADPVWAKYAMDDYNYGRAVTPVGRLGYTQCLAFRAIQRLKLGLTADWVKANYPFDEYVDPTVSAAANAAREDETIYKGMIGARIARIKQDNYGNSSVVEAISRNNPAKLGYTQMLAYTAIWELKAEKSIPADRWGTGKDGHTAWVKSNYPFDTYMVPEKPVVPVVPPVVKLVDPNPASTGSATEKVAPVVTYIPDPVVVATPFFQQPIVKLAIIAIGIILFIKIISK